MTRFEECFSRAISEARIPPRPLAPGECRTPSGTVCRLCHGSALGYPDELRIKNSALGNFWKLNKLPLPLEPIVPSPSGRAYRAITKRKLFYWRGEPKLGLIRDDGGQGGRPYGIDVDRCAIEPDSHRAVYERVAQYLASSKDRLLAESLQYVVVKEGTGELTVILNVDSFEPAVLKKVNALSKALTSSVRGIAGVFLFRDEKRSRYYLPSGEGNEHSFRKVFGKREIFQKIFGRSFLYSPLSFSQTNRSIVETLIERVGTMLDLSPGMHLYDLYCGYGPFALSLAGKAAAVAGIELSSVSVEAAKANAERQHVRNAKFLRQDVTRETVASLLRKGPKPFSVILDPPRGGTAEGVIETIAAHRPERAVHIFCDIERIKHELGRWKKGGYVPVTSVPFDMFPGTNELELVVCLKHI